jgi:hypothetical protein
MSPPDHPQPPQTAGEAADLERAQFLIPGYLKKSLKADDYQWMTQFLNQLHQRGQADPQAAQREDAFLQEMAWVERSQQQIAQDTPAFDAHLGWQRMEERLAAGAAPAAAKKPQPATISPLPNPVTWAKEQFAALIDRATAWWKKPVIGALASAMIVGQMGLLAAVVKQMSPQLAEVTSAAPLSGSQSVDGAVVLSVVFKDSASLLEVRTLVDSVQGRVVGGPGALGVWEVAVPKEKGAEALKTFIAAPAVESASPP